MEPKAGRRAKGAPPPDDRNEAAKATSKNTWVTDGGNTDRVDDGGAQNASGALNLTSLDGGITDKEVAEAVAARRQQEEELAQEVAAAPTEYHSVMPKLSELDVGGGIWSTFLQTCSEEFDLTPITTCLCPQLDEDEPWNPEMLLVQLTSDLLDKFEREADGSLRPAGNDPTTEKAVTEGISRRGPPKAAVKAKEGKK